jgi:F-type H+-transporting ATPase subunit delta
LCPGAYALFLKRVRLGHRKPKESAVAGPDPTASGMAGRYATALFELAQEGNVIDAVKSDLDRLDGLIGESPDLLRLVRSPVFTADEQTRAIAAVLNQAGIGGLAANFIKLVASNRRLFAVRDMIKVFCMLVARHKGEITAEVTVADEISPRRLDEIKAALNAVTGKDVQVDVRIDPAIIGGLVVKLGSRMVDSSLRTRLNALKHAMKEVG